MTQSSPHALQTSAWGALKSRFGWTDERVGLSRDGELIAGAQVLFRRLLPGLLHLAYVPKGPLVDWTDKEQTAALMAALDRVARSRRAFALTIEPDLRDESAHRERLLALGFRKSPFGALQPRRTLLVDISPDEAGVLAEMKSKTRYNVRLATRKAVTVREADEADLPSFDALMATTAERDRFGVHSPAYYKAAYELFVPQGLGRLLLAEVAGEPVAAIMVLAIPPRAWYFYGASANTHREKMPTYLLQWEAIRWAKSLGCIRYDLWGIPDEDYDTLEAQFARRGDGLWGVYRFKRGFGGQVTRSVGAWDRVYSQPRYWMYCRLVDARRRVMGTQ